MEDEHLLFEFEDFYDHDNTRSVLLWMMLSRGDTKVREMVNLAGTMGLRLGVMFIDKKTGEVI